MARSGRRRWGRVLLVVTMTYVCLGLLLRPASPMRLAPVAGQPLLWRGAYHVHTTRSDGSGTPEEVAAAAAAAGLQFVILTDHGDGTRAPDPPRYVDGVLLMDGVEISTDAGHYVAIGMRQTPFPIGGDAAGVAADVKRFGGLRIVAHPDSPRAALAWHEPSVIADGIEWLNADSVWRSARPGQLLLRLSAYPFNTAGALAALATYPQRLFEQYDKPGVFRGDLTLAAVDAHARIGWRRDRDPLECGLTLARFPSYRAMFGTFGVVIPWIGGAPSGRAQDDADAVMHFLHQRLAFSAVFSMAETPYLRVEAERRESPYTVAPPDIFEGRRSGSAMTLRVASNAPADAVIRMRRNGVPWREAAAPNATFEVDPDEGHAIYRAELWLPPRRGWPELPVAMGHSVAHNPPGDREYGERPSTVPPPFIVTGWHGEHDPRSSVVIGPPAGAIATATLSLANTPRTSQFAALVADLAPPPPGATGVELRVSTDAPMRLSLQLRVPQAGDGLRWRTSMFAGNDGDPGYAGLSNLRAVPPAAGQVPLDRVHALLFVMDTVNAQPGTRRTIAIRELRWTFDR